MFTKSFLILSFLFHFLDIMRVDEKWKLNWTDKDLENFQGPSGNTILLETLSKLCATFTFLVTILDSGLCLADFMAFQMYLRNYLQFLPHHLIRFDLIKRLNVTGTLDKSTFCSIMRAYHFWWIMFLVVHFIYVIWGAF